MTPVDAPVLAEFHPRDAVRLLVCHGDVPSGTRGRIVGRFARSADPTYVVSFENAEAVCAVDVRADELVLETSTR